MYDKNNNIGIKDSKIMKLEMQMQTLRQDAITQDKIKDKLRTEIKDWKKKFEVE
jgi:hypothetical protein